MNKFMRNDNASTRQKQTHFFIWSISIRHAKKQIRVYALFFSFFFCSEIKFSNNYQAFQRWKRGQKSNETIFMAKITWLKYFKNTLNSNMMVYLRSFHFCQFPCICMCLAFFFFAEFLNSKKKWRNMFRRLFFVIEHFILACGKVVSLPHTTHFFLLVYCLLNNG